MGYVLIEITDRYEDILTKGSALVSQKLTVCAPDPDDVELVHIANSSGGGTIYAIITLTDCVQRAIDEHNIPHLCAKTYAAIYEAAPDSVSVVEIQDSDRADCVIV